MPSQYIHQSVGNWDSSSFKFGHHNEEIHTFIVCFICRIHGQLLYATQPDLVYQGIKLHCHTVYVFILERGRNKFHQPITLPILMLLCLPLLHCWIELMEKNAGRIVRAWYHNSAWPNARSARGHKTDNDWRYPYRVLNPIHLTEGADISSLAIALIAYLQTLRPPAKEKYHHIQNASMNRWHLLFFCCHLSCCERAKYWEIDVIVDRRVRIATKIFCTLWLVDCTVRCGQASSLGEWQPNNSLLQH